MSTRIKICGITRIEDADEAARLGVDAIGLVFYPRSPRRLGLEAACAIRDRLPPFVSTVALFLDAPAGEVREVVGKLRPELLQFHGSEPGEYCSGFGVPYIKAISMADDGGAVDNAGQYADARAWLLDSHAMGGAGGTGRSFDWSRIPGHLPVPLVLAGGLNPGNVGQAIRQAHPYAVDVSSGVESAPGIKDHGLMAAFVKSVRDADNDHACQ
jgi:phosphoribosylanthranilate isomerase